MADRPGVPNGFDASTPNPARIYNYWLGGKDYFLADLAVAQAVLAATPEVRDMVRENRAFLRRAVRFLAGEAGVRQFIDIGTGLPTQGNVHEVALRVAPDARVVYVDNDPVVLAHANALLAGERTSIVDADLLEPDTILEHPTVREVIDFERPVGLLLFAILHLFPDTERLVKVVAWLRDAIVTGSYLAVSHAAGDISPEAADKAARAYRPSEQSRSALRGHGEIMRFFEGFDLVAPGLVQLPCWRPDGPVPDDLSRCWVYGGVARKS